MERVVITQSSNLMMGSSWECELVLRNVEQRFGSSLGIAQLPAFLVSKGDKVLVLTGVPTATMLSRAVESL